MSERTIFLGALEIPNSAERSQFLDRECGGDSRLRQEVEALIAAHDQAGDFLQRPAVAVENLSPPPSSAVPGSEPTAVLDAADASDKFPFLAPSQRADAIGRLSHYEILAPLGQGAFGSVFKAFDTRLDRIVAVKVLAPELAASGGARRRFIREAKAAASVRHEHVVNIHAVDEEPIPHLVMECIIGQTLQQKIDRTGALPVVEILRIGYQIASGLSAAHALGLIHRDIKPANILLENGIERVKITDFGLARTGDDASLTQSGIVCGTPMYMAPEQAQGEPLDSRADLFSVGSTLYAMCTGRPPFRATTTMAVLKRVIEDQPRPIREINPEIPDWLSEIIEKLLAKRPADRFASAAEVATLLGQHLAHLQHPATTPVPPRVGRARPASPKWTDEDLESVSDLAWGVLLVFLPVWSLLLALDGAIRKGMPGPLMRAPEDVARTLMVCFGFLAACAAAVSWWVPKGVWRNIASSVAAGALFVAVAEGMHWIRVGETLPPPVATLARPSALPPAPHSAGAGWVDLLHGDEVRRLAESTTGATFRDGHLVLHPTPQQPLVRMALNTTPFREGSIRLRAVCLRREPGFALTVGMTHESGTPRQIEGTFQSPQATGPAQLHLRRRDAEDHPRTLVRNDAIPIEVGTELALELEAKAGQFRFHIDRHVLHEPRALQEGRDVVPFLEVTGSDWEIVEWSVHRDDDSVPVDLLNWGRFVNPTDEGNLVRFYDRVAFEVPAARLFQLSPEAGANLDAPRLIGDVDGDFEISVAIPRTDRISPETQSLSGSPVCAQAAGLLLWSSDKTFLRFERVTERDHENGTPTLRAAWFGEGAPLGDEREVVPEILNGPAHLKMHRWGDRIQLFWSRDALDWTLWRTVANLPLPSRTQVGLLIRNSTDAPFAANFERFRLRGTASPEGGVAHIPFTPPQAQQWQASTAKEHSVPVEYANGLGMKLRLIPAGEFTMGMSIDEINDVLSRPHPTGLDRGLLEFMTHSGGPPHKVHLTHPYYIGTTEVTVGQFRQFVTETGYQPTERLEPGRELATNQVDLPVWVKDPIDESEDLPATRVTWHEARRFCRWLSEKEGVEYTLPTEAQWEFACRAGVPERWSFGDDRSELPDYAWFGLGYHDPPKPVGKKKPNAFGLYDMLGNAHEWVQDWHQREFFTESPINDPVCTKPGVGRVCRGGWWWDSADLIRSGSRGYNVPDLRYPGCGFRVAIVPPFGKLPKVAPQESETEPLKR